MKWKKKVDAQNNPSYIFYQRAYHIIRDNQKIVKKKKTSSGIVNCRFKKSIVGFDDAKELREYLISLWEAQGGRCYYTGEIMSLTGYPQGEHKAFTVDKIEPSLGYVKGNIVLCCSIVNRIKQDLTISQLKSWVNLINLDEKSSDLK